jgi:spore coat polysaccharide biosynthesis protein SpsF
MIIAMIQARLGSTRFNEKIMHIVNGKTLLMHCYERVKQSKLVDRVSVLIPKKDYFLLDYCLNNNIEVFRGPEHDVLKRFYNANKRYKADHIVRITSDCPLIDPYVIDESIHYHLLNKSEITTNSMLGKESYPDGMDVTVFTKETLERLNNEATGKHREHVTSYAMENKDKYDFTVVPNLMDLSRYRLTLDYYEDFLLINNIIDHFGEKSPSMQDIVEYLNDNPDVMKLNSKYARNEGYYN